MTPIPIRPEVITGSSAASPGKAVSVLAAGILAASLLFFAFPGIDLAVSGWFHDSASGFVLANNPALRSFRASSTWMLAAVVLLALGQMARHAWRGRAVWRHAPRSLWLLAGLALGPGLLVNGLLKTYWGRPRPIETEVFGGGAPFQKVWVISDWCDRNCSFVSGEASSGAWLVAAALVTPRRIRPVVTVLAVTYALLLSLNRIAFGGHYLSDVVIAWLLCALVFMLLYRFVLLGGARETWRALTFQY
jgi:lipid A 4'-phosphatase